MGGIAKKNQNWVGGHESRGSQSANSPNLGWLKINPNHSFQIYSTVDFYTYVDMACNMDFFIYLFFFFI